MTSRVLFCVALICGLAVSIHASKCQDAIVLNLGVSQAEAKSLCGACMAVLPCSQCTTCFQAAKTLLDAAQCPAAKSTSARKLLDIYDYVNVYPSPAPPPPSPTGAGIIIKIGR